MLSEPHWRAPEHVYTHINMHIKFVYQYRRYAIVFDRLVELLRLRNLHRVTRLPTQGSPRGANTK